MVLGISAAQPNGMGGERKRPRATETERERERAQGRRMKNLSIECVVSFRSDDVVCSIRKAMIYARNEPQFAFRH